MTYEESRAEVKRMAAIIKERGTGASKKWSAIATAAMGNEKYWPMLEELLGHPVTSQLDLYNVLSACTECMTRMQVSQMGLDAGLQLKAGEYAVTMIEQRADDYLANRLQAVRIGTGLTQKQLADKSGLSLTIIKSLENNARSMSKVNVAYAMRIAAALGTTVEDLFG